MGKLNFLKTHRLFAGFLALVLVAGMASPAFAGKLVEPITECAIIQNQMVDMQIGENEKVLIPKTIECDSLITGLTIGGDTCEINDPLGFSDLSGISTNTITFNEIVENAGNLNEEHCTVTWDVLGNLGSNVEVTQELWFNVNLQPIGGTSIPVSTTSLLVAGAQANMGLMSLALVGIVGAAAAITYKLKSKKTEQ